MNANLNRYLSLVLRNEVENQLQENNTKHSQALINQTMDINTPRFVVDCKYSLGLDEII